MALNKSTLRALGVLELSNSDEEKEEGEMDEERRELESKRRRSWILRQHCVRIPNARHKRV